MIASGYKYTIGSYNELPEGPWSTSGEVLLASTLAWASQNDIPFPQAMLSLTETGSVDCIKTGLKRDIFVLPGSKNWNKCLVRAARDLLAGMPLYSTLQKRLSYFLPEYYLQAVEMAEKNGNLPEVLPHFAKRINLSARIRVSYKLAVTGPLIEFFLSALLLLFMTTLIFPNFSKIFDELLAGEHTPATDLFRHPVRNNILYFFTFLIYGIPAFNLINRFFRKYVLMISGEILIWLPYFRTQIKDIATLELAASIASYLSCGEDIISAAKFSRQACRHLWLRRKMTRFIRKLETGTDWLEAWQDMRLNQPLNDLILRNAAARENIVDGFDSIADWFYQRTISNSRNNTIWLFLACFTVNAAIVLLIAYCVFASLTMIIEKVI